MSEEQKKLFYTILKDAYEQGVESEKITLSALLKDITEKLELIVVKR
jgi:hypothetical protein